MIVEEQGTGFRTRVRFPPGPLFARKLFRKKGFRVFLCTHFVALQQGGEDITMRFEVILWDVDGTLLDFPAAERAAIRKLFPKFGLGNCTDEMLKRYSVINRKYWNKLERGEMTKPQILVGRFEEFFSAEGMDPSVSERFNEAYQLCLGDTIVFCDHSKELVASLRGKIRQYVVSNGTVIAQTKKLKRSGFDELMDGIFLSEQVGFEKPAKEFFDCVFEELKDVNRDKVLIVGDSLTSDILGGNHAGIKTCWYNPQGIVNDTRARVDYEVRDLEEILGVI